MPKTFYVTTPIYYASGPPHLGHAYTTIAADVIARFKKLQGYDVFFITGTDEHGQKVEKAAREQGKTPKQFVDEIAQTYKDLFTALNIEYDCFARTTDQAHEKAVQNIFQRFYDEGLIYKGTYKGWYCIYDENFVTELQLVDGKCPDCNRPVQREKQETYFFKLSAFREKLKILFEENHQFLQPESRWHETYNFFKDELRDLSVTRKGLNWGVEVPFDKQHTVYVWLDALFFYLTFLGYNSKTSKLSGKAKKYWPANIQLVGKEIVKFHAVYWPAFLWAAQLPLPKQIYAHGWWTVEGEKMSKSKGNFIDPHTILPEYGADAFRYFVMRENSFGEDGDYSAQAFKARYNGELADELGNLLNRTLVMLYRFSNGEVPAAKNSKLKTEVAKKVAVYEKQMEVLQFNRALETTWEILRSANQLINKTEPWKLAKEGKTEQVNIVLRDLAESLRVSALLLYPFTPAKSAEIYSTLGLKGIEKEKLTNAKKWNLVKTGTKTADGIMLFPKKEAK